MRKMLFLALAASTLAPMAAQAQGGPDHGPQPQEQRDGRHDDRRDDRHEERRDMRQDRRDDRQDWRGYRETHREAFRGGGYVGPRGFAYRPVAPGYRFAPDYYGQRYWVNNPAAYRLPPAPMGQRWVRYGRDVVRVDLHSGRVIQVFAQFFL